MKNVCGVAGKLTWTVLLVYLTSLVGVDGTLSLETSSGHVLADHVVTRSHSVMVASAVWTGFISMWNLVSYANIYLLIIVLLSLFLVAAATVVICFKTRE